MIQSRSFKLEDVDSLQKAIDADTFHHGECKVAHFIPSGGPSLVSNVIEDQRGPIAFVRYTKTLRISCVWNDGDDNSRNARAIIFGVKDAVEKARASGFSEIIITTAHPKLAMFFEKVLKMTKSDGEYILAV